MLTTAKTAANSLETYIKEHLQALEGLSLNPQIKERVTENILEAHSSRKEDPLFQFHYIIDKPETR